MHIKKLLISLLVFSTSGCGMNRALAPLIINPEAIVIPTPNPLPQPANPALLPPANGADYFKLLPGDLKRTILVKLCEDGDSLRERMRTLIRYQMVNKEHLNLLQHIPDATRDALLCAMIDRLACKWRGNKFDDVAIVWQHAYEPLMPNLPLAQTPQCIFESVKRIRNKFQALQGIFKNPQRAEDPEVIQKCFEEGLPFTHLIQTALATNDPEKLQRSLAFMKSAAIPEQRIDLEKKYLSFKMAILNHEHELVEDFIASGINVERPILGHTPLMLAANARAGSTITKLLLAGASVNQTAINGDTPLLIAVDSAYHEIVEILLQAGAQVNHSNMFGETPLMRAALFEPANNHAPNTQEAENEEYEQIHAHKNTVQTLLAYGAHVNVQNPRDKLTPLMLATLNDHETMVGQLLAAGADPSITDTAGETALDIARKKNNISLIELLTQAEKKIAEEVESTLKTRSGCKKRKVIYYEDERSDNESEVVSDNDSVVSHKSEQSEASTVSNRSRESEHSNDSYYNQISDLDDERSLGYESPDEEKSDRSSHDSHRSDDDYRPTKRRR